MPPPPALRCAALLCSSALPDSAPTAAPPPSLFLASLFPFPFLPCSAPPLLTSRRPSHEPTRALITRFARLPCSVPPTIPLHCPPTYPNPTTTTTTTTTTAQLPHQQPPLPPPPTPASLLASSLPTSKNDAISLFGLQQPEDGRYVLSRSVHPTVPPANPTPEVIREKVQDGVTGETRDLAYTQCKIVGNGSFGVVFQTKLSPSGEDAAIKRVLQDKRFKACASQFRHPG